MPGLVTLLEVSVTLSMRLTMSGLVDVSTKQMNPPPQESSLLEREHIRTFTQGARLNIVSPLSSYRTYSHCTEYDVAQIIYPPCPMCRFRLHVSHFHAKHCTYCVSSICGIAIAYAFTVPITTGWLEVEGLPNDPVRLISQRPRH